MIEISDIKVPANLKTQHLISGDSLLLTVFLILSIGFAHGVTWENHGYPTQFELGGTGGYTGFNPAYDTESDRLVFFNTLIGYENDYSRYGIWTYDLNTNLWEYLGYPAQFEHGGTGGYTGSNPAYDSESDRLVFFNTLIGYENDYSRYGIWSFDLQHIGPTWHVSTDGSHELADGSLENPFPTIQFGIDASQNGDTILVQPGTYTENINFSGKNIVLGSLYLTTNDTSYISTTIIDGGAISSVVSIISGETEDCMLTGFSLRNGYSRDSDGMNNGYGGGICIRNYSEPILSNLIVENNQSQWEGGGIFIETSNPIIRNSIVRGNIGGGIASISVSSPLIEDCTIYENTSEWGAGITIAGEGSNVDINRTIIRDNIATQYGGGLYASGSQDNPSIVTLSNVTIEGNEAAQYGGGVLLTSVSFSTINESQIMNNSAGDHAGGIYCVPCNLEMNNSEITNNTATNYGAGIYLNYTQQVNNTILNNVTIAGNVAGNYAGGVFMSNQQDVDVLLHNSIVWDNLPNEIYLNSTGNINTIEVKYSDIQSGLDGIIGNSNGDVQWLAGNQSLDPSFAGGVLQPYALNSNSPCIDAGDPDLDADGDTWDIDPDDQDPDGTRIDMGAYNYDQSSVTHIDSSGLFLLKQYSGIYEAYIYNNSNNEWVSNFTDPPLGQAATIMSSVFHSKTNTLYVLTEYSDYIELYSYSPEDNIWITLDAPPITGGVTDMYPAYDDINNKMLLIRKFNDFIDLHVYDVTTNSWESNIQQPENWGGIDDVAWVYHHYTNRTYLIREYGGNSWMYSYDYDTNSWRIEDSLLPLSASLANLSATSNTSDNQIYIAGQDFVGVWIRAYNPSTYVWEDNLSAPPLNGGGVNSLSLTYDFVNDDVLLLRKYENFIDIYAFDPVSDTWRDDLAQPVTAGGISNVTTSFYSFLDEENPPYDESILYVSVEGSDNQGSGSEHLPLRTIQHAINRASVGDTILVEPGQYLENLFLLDKDLTICSRFLYDPDTSLTGNTVIDGNDNGCILSEQLGAHSMIL